MNEAQSSSIKRTGQKVIGTVLAVGALLAANPDMVASIAQHVKAVYADLLALAGIGLLIWGTIKSHWASK
jgi:hypothetical protein